MSGTTLDLETYLTTDDLACRISDQWITWNNQRQIWMKDKEEIQRYVFATDTTKTSNSMLPWSNKTTIPKLCQIRDNLFANYMATMFPKNKNIVWEGSSKIDESKSKAIEAYMTWVVDRPEFYAEMSKLVLDYIDYGNCFAIPEWFDKRDRRPDAEAVATYVGPRIRRINPMDIVFDPTAITFAEAPKIIRSIISVGEVKELLERVTNRNRKETQELYDYLMDIRKNAKAYPGETITKDVIYDIAGFTSYRNYLESNNVEILTFYGDIYNQEKDTFERNQIVKVIDRHKVLSQEANPSFFGTAPIYHVGWRIRPDNLWAMGPLDNLVGLQYRIDHIENMKADCWDLTRYPVFKVKGYVQDFDWSPGEKIFIGDDGDVELLAPDPGVLQANTEIAVLEQKMEEMAGSPKEAMGFRTPGEKTKYEVQRLENAASRIFQNKTSQYERNFAEPIYNGMLELARRYMDDSVIRIFDSEFKVADFRTLTPEDITGNGRIKPMAARHFAEQSQLVQDLNAFFSSAVGQDPLVLVHFSGQKIARMFERLLDIEEQEIVSPYIRISEQSEMQMMSQVANEQSQMAATTPSGMGNDYDINSANTMVQGPGLEGSGGQEGPPPTS